MSLHLICPPPLGNHAPKEVLRVGSMYNLDRSHLVYNVTIVLIWFPTASHATNFLCYSYSMGGSAECRI